MTQLTNRQSKIQIYQRTTKLKTCSRRIDKFIVIIYNNEFPNYLKSRLIYNGYVLPV